MENTPQYSVIIATYNRAEYLRITLDSIVHQSFTDIEILVIDDGSIDHTADIVESFRGNRMIYIKTENWGGPARPRNIGIERAKGKYLAFCDDDDVWVPEKLSIISQIIEDTGVEFIFSRVKYIDSHSQIIGESPRMRRSEVLPIKSEALVLNNMIPLSSVVVSRTLLGDDKFSVNQSFVAAEDALMWFELNSRSEIFHCVSPLIHYRVHESNISGNRSKRFKLNKRVRDYIQEKYAYDQGLIILAEGVSEIKMGYIDESRFKLLYRVAKLLIQSIRNRRGVLLLRTLIRLRK